MASNTWANPPPRLLIAIAQPYEPMHSLTLWVRDRALDLELATLYRIWQHHLSTSTLLCFFCLPCYPSMSSQFLSFFKPQVKCVITSQIFLTTAAKSITLSCPLSFTSGCNVSLGHSQPWNYYICLFTRFPSLSSSSM